MERETLGGRGRRRLRTQTHGEIPLLVGGKLDPATPCNSLSALMNPLLVLGTPNRQRRYAKWKLSRCTVVCSTHCIHVFVRLAPICMLSQCLLTKFLNRSSVGSLLKVHCWLGTRRDTPPMTWSRRIAFFLFLL